MNWYVWKYSEISPFLWTQMSMRLLLIRVIYSPRKWDERQKKSERDDLSIVVLAQQCTRCTRCRHCRHCRHLLKGHTLGQADQVTTPDTPSLISLYELENHFAASLSFCLFSLPPPPAPPPRALRAVDEREVWKRAAGLTHFEHSRRRMIIFIAQMYHPSHQMSPGSQAKDADEAEASRESAAGKRKNTHPSEKSMAWIM